MNSRSIVLPTSIYSLWSSLSQLKGTEGCVILPHVDDQGTARVLIIKRRQVGCMEWMVRSSWDIDVPMRILCWNTSIIFIKPYTFTTVPLTWSAQFNSRGSCSMRLGGTDFEANSQEACGIWSLPTLEDNLYQLVMVKKNHSERIIHSHWPRKPAKFLQHSFDRGLIQPCIGKVEPPRPQKERGWTKRQRITSILLHGWSLWFVMSAFQWTKRQQFATFSSRVLPLVCQESMKFERLGKPGHQ